MTKQEISEIKKLFTPKNCSITRICGCYVDGEKNKKTELKQAFLALPEEEMFKYFEILRKSLSGTIGKNLLNLEFPLKSETEGGTQEFLLRLRDSRLKDDALLEQFYDRIIESYEYVGNYQNSRRERHGVGLGKIVQVFHSFCYCFEGLAGGGRENPVVRENLCAV